MCIMAIVAVSQKDVGGEKAMRVVDEKVTFNKWGLMCSHYNIATRIDNHDDPVTH